MNYQKIYEQIIERAKTRQLKEYSEKHHIIPKCIGGEDKKENIIQLTAKEHFLCHKLLCEIYPNNIKLKQSLWLMTIGKNTSKGKHYKISSREYERLKKQHSLLMKGNKLHLNHKHTEETKRKIGEANKQPKSDEHKQKISLSQKGISKIKKRKPIIQYDLEGNFRKEWPSAVEAAKYLNIDNGAISNCCSGKQKTAYKSIWKFKII